MGQIRILPDQVANQIAAGEVVDRPASVVKELLENALDAGAMRIRVEVEGGGRKLIRVSDDGQGMNRDDALLAFERHATSKLRTADDLLSIATLGFRGLKHFRPSHLSRYVTRQKRPLGMEQPPKRVSARISKSRAAKSIAWKTRRCLAAPPSPSPISSSTRPRGANFCARNPLSWPTSPRWSRTTRWRILKSNSIFSPPPTPSSPHLPSPAPPSASFRSSARRRSATCCPSPPKFCSNAQACPEPPPWRRGPGGPCAPARPTLRLTGFYSKPELQKLSTAIPFTSSSTKRLIRSPAPCSTPITEAYRNVIPPTSFPVVLLFLEMPPEEVDVNVHPAKTEIRFRQVATFANFVRDWLRTALIKARPAAGFLAALDSQPSASPSLMPPAASPLPGAPDSDPQAGASSDAEPFHLTPHIPASIPGALPFERPSLDGQNLDPRNLDAQAWGEAANALLAGGASADAGDCSPSPNGTAAYANNPATVAAATAAATSLIEAEQAANSLNRLGSLKPIGQLRDSFILASGEDGLWIIDQHVAHERVLFEKILRDRQVERVQRQRLLMPMLVELKPEQMVVFARIAEELEVNGFEVEPFGPQTLAVKASPVGLEGAELERTLAEVIDQSTGDSEEPSRNEELNRLRSRIAASIACHSAIKVNTALDTKRIEWLLLELGKTSHPTSCPHGRPIALLYSWKEILRAFHRI